MKKTLLFLFFWGLPWISFSQTKLLDEIRFGDRSSEKTHGLVIRSSETYRGGLGEPARRLLPLGETDYRGGTLKFRLKTDPTVQNYCTFRLWGSEKDWNYCMLFIEGNPIGYRHLGDFENIYRGNGEAPSMNRFFYSTLVLPLQWTKGKHEVELEVRSYGRIWGYGGSFELFQRPMTEPTVGFYKAYTHTTPAFIPDRKEKQGLMRVQEAPLRPEDGSGIMEALKKRVEDELRRELEQESPLNQLQTWTLSDAYRVSWTSAYRNPKVVERVREAIDHHCMRWQEDPELLDADRSLYNPDWLVVGPFARALRNVWAELLPSMEDSVEIGGGYCTRRAAWSRMFEAGVIHSNRRRRQYTNQGMIVDLFLYHMNKALVLLAPEKALPEYQTLRYLYESVGLAPWLGAQRADGSFAAPVGENYYQLTAKGLTKELGFVGYYGEVLDWVNDLYQSTCTPGVRGSGDGIIRAQLLRMQQARTYFRYPAVDRDGYRAMRIEAVVGWRDGGHYPGNVLYADRGVAWDATPMQTAYTTADPVSIGMTRQLLDDNQYWQLLQDKMKEKGLRTTHALLFVPDEYEWMRQQQAETKKMPMDASMPDFVFSDEENGVVALKHRGEILYASLYWRARRSVNRLACVHRINDRYENIGVVYLDSVDFEDSGFYYTRSEGNAMNFADWGNAWYQDEGVSAHSGEREKIARVTAGNYQPGQEHPEAGRCRWYQLQYGPYLIGMNNSRDRNYTLSLPPGKNRVLNLSAGGMNVAEEVVVTPKSTVVLYVE